MGVCVRSQTWDFGIASLGIGLSVWEVKGMV